jgi:hypothetical protein
MGALGIAPLRQVRGELRLYRRPAVVVLWLGAACLQAALLLVGQAHARDQVAVALDQPVLSCSALATNGIPPTRCAAVQASQRASAVTMAELAEQVGPPGASSHTVLGVASLSLGHAATAIGLGLAVAVAALVYGGEAVAGVAAGRDRWLLGRRVLAVRAAALTLVLASAAVGTIAVLIVVGAIADIGQSWPQGTDHRATATFLAGRAVGALATIVLAALVLVMIRRWSATRASLLAAGAAVLGVALGAVTVGSAVVPPTNLVWAVADFRDPQPSYLDRVPLGLRLPSPSFASDAAMVVAMVVALALVITAAVQLLRR